MFAKIADEGAYGGAVGVETVEIMLQEFELLRGTAGDGPAKGGGRVTEDVFAG